MRFVLSWLRLQDNTEQGVLVLLRGLLNVISQSNETISPDTKCTVYIKVLSLLTAYSQDRYIYTVDKGIGCFMLHFNCYNCF